MRLFYEVLKGTGDDYGHAIVPMADGNFVLAGYTSSFGAGNNDVLIARWDVDGVLRWSKTLGGVADDWGLGIDATTDGDVILVGQSTIGSPSTDDMTGNIDLDVLVAKYDANGRLLWAKIMGGPGDEYGDVIQVTADGGFVSAGDTNSYGAGGYDALVMRWDSDGTLLWARALGGSEDDWELGIQETIDGGFISTGYTASFGTDGYALISKWNGSGDLLLNDN